MDCPICKGTGTVAVMTLIGPMKDNCPCTYSETNLVLVCEIWFENERAEADARLIAAAPKLLEALKDMLRGADLVMAETLDGGNPFPTLAHAAQKAQITIAKAQA